MLPLALIAAGAGAIIKGIKAHHQNKLADQVVVPDATYTKSPYAENTLAMAKQMFNSQMPGEETAIENIKGNQANTQAGVERNSGSGAQSLALLAAGQGITDNAFNNLQEKEGTYKAQEFNNVANANQGMTAEGDKVYQDMVRKQMLAIQEKNALRGAANANAGGAMNDIINGAFIYQLNPFGKTKTPGATASASAGLGY